MHISIAYTESNGKSLGMVYAVERKSNKLEFEISKLVL